MAFTPFEKSPADKEVPGMPEGSPAEKAMDTHQAHAGPTHSAKKPNPPFMPFGKHPGAKPA